MAESSHGWEVTELVEELLGGHLGQVVALEFEGNFYASPLAFLRFDGSDHLMRRCFICLIVLNIQYEASQPPFLKETLKIKVKQGLRKVRIQPYHQRRRQSLSISGWNFIDFTILQYIATIDLFELEIFVDTGHN